MGEKRVKVRFCDHCGTDDQPISSHTLGWDRKRWSLDLCVRCHEELDRYLYAVPGIPRRTESRTQPKGAPYKAAEGVDLTEVRKWAHLNEIPVSRRGRIASEVIEKWRQESRR